ncbi:hypothetical protein GSI_02405 [Ganoderma sinense ZZ0214-1]|uniref:Cytoplasmic tRNA 2-thiolation protein 2 n=1 Tax=Ganoderma sinense ZZ0214-1 TaxID=1077348 RepID=A0A2G8SPI6_9APHY|nr:hypothetical protein GSI_02405 [Ganoderma sinense ZZ0214-1]
MLSTASLSNIRIVSYCLAHIQFLRNCFFPLTTHKFRRALEPNVNPKPDGPRKTALKPAGNLLVGFSGGLGSSVLVDLVHRCYVSLDKSTMPTEGGRDHPRHERVWKKITVCYIEVCDVFPGMTDKTEAVANLVSRYDELELVALRIRDAFDPSWWERVRGKPAFSEIGVSLADQALFMESLSHFRQDPLAALHTYFSSLPTPTAVHTSIQTLTRVLLLYTALHTGSSHLILGTSLTSLAVSLISGVAQGSGFNVREEMLEEWSPDPGVTEVPELWPEDGKRAQKLKRTVRIVRPLRDIGMKECAAWAWWSHIPVVGKEKWLWPGAKPGIGTLTKDFILGLEQDYPSTVSTIVRTCAKLQPKGEVDGKCILCGRPSQRGVQEWKARISIRSQPPPPPSAQRPLPIVEESPDHASLTPYLCYPCHTTLTSRSARPVSSPWPNTTQPSVVSLPMWTEARLSTTNKALAESNDEEVVRQRKLEQGEMKGIVDQFLLED